MRKALVGLVAFLMLNYVAIDLAHIVGAIRQFPLFLFFENVFWLTLYAISLYCLRKNETKGYLILSSVAWYNAGRVSRSVITPYGELPKLWIPHLFLELIILIVALLSTLQLKEKLTNT